MHKRFYPVGSKASYKRPEVHKYRHKPAMAHKFLGSTCITLSPLHTHTHTQAQKNWDETMLPPSSCTLLQVLSLGSSDLCHRTTHDGREGTMNPGHSEMFPAYVQPVWLHLKTRALRSMIAFIFMIASPVTWLAQQLYAAAKPLRVGAKWPRPLHWECLEAVKAKHLDCLGPARC